MFLKFIVQHFDNICFDDKCSHIKSYREYISAVAKHFIRTGSNLEQKNSNIIKPTSSFILLNAWESFFINKSKASKMAPTQNPLVPSKSLIQYFHYSNRRLLIIFNFISCFFNVYTLKFFIWWTNWLLPSLINPY